MKYVVFGAVALALLAALVFFVVPPFSEHPIVVIDTSMGPIKVELYQNKAPITVKNFLQYVDDKQYDGTTFHRVISNFMIQGGGFEPGMKKRSETRAPIKNEGGNGLRNERGTIAMARTSEPDSASTEFFINVVDNKFLDRPDSPDKVGYAVFGKVIDGMKVVDKIREVETVRDVPVQDVIIRSIRRADR